MKTKQKGKEKYLLNFQHSHYFVEIIINKLLCFEPKLN